MARVHTPSTHPLTPPLTKEGWLEWLRLLRSRRVGPTTFHRLLAEHGSAAAALDALPGVAAKAGVANYAPATTEVAEAEWTAAERAGAVPLAIGSAPYPALLAMLPDAPPFLWAIGDPALLDRPLIALVGARSASSLGLRMARRLAAELGEAGHVVVSGLARGIDTAAHQGALPHGTVAVFAGGVDVIYPSENAALAQEIGETGLILSEQPMHLSPQARHFPARNRIIAGLASATVVVEAASKSGSLLTARAALDTGREVLAVPGHPFDARAGGCNMLIRDGAALVRGARDVIEALATAGMAAQSPSVADSGTAPDETATGTTDRSALRRRDGRPTAASAPASPPETRRADAPRPPTAGRTGPDDVTLVESEDVPDQAALPETSSHEEDTTQAGGAQNIKNSAPAILSRSHRASPSKGDAPQQTTADHARNGTPPSTARAAPDHARRTLTDGAIRNGAGKLSGAPPAAQAVLHRRILDRLGPSPVAEDQLIRDLDLAPSLVTQEITELELEGRIARRPGGLLSLPV